MIALRGAPPLRRKLIFDPEARTNPKNDLCVLVVDDEPALRGVVSAMLELLGYHVLTAPEGEEALRIAAADGGPYIDVLLTDFNMPVMLGDELARRFHEACPKAGIIIMSSESAELPGTPHCEFLPKPFHLAALREKVLAVLPD